MDQIELAIAHLKAQKQLNYAEAARLFGVEPTTLRRRYLGITVSRAQVNSEHRQLLNNVQEDTLLRYIDKLTERHIPPTTQIIKNLAEEILGGPVGINWPARFVKRHKNRISSVYLRPLDRARTASENAAVFEHFYRLLTQAIEKYNLEPQDIYNWDEKGFMIGKANIKRRIMNKEAYDSGRIRYVSAGNNVNATQPPLRCVDVDISATQPPPRCVDINVNVNGLGDDISCIDRGVFGAQ